MIGKVSLIFLIVAVALAAALFGDDKCSYDHCKKELKDCKKGKTQAECVKKNRLYISYKTGTLSLGREHVCCDWELKAITDKYLHCVTKIRTNQNECKDGTEKGYVFKMKTKKECTKFSCF